MELGNEAISSKVGGFWCAGLQAKSKSFVLPAFTSSRRAGVRFSPSWVGAKQQEQNSGTRQTVIAKPRRH